MIDPYLEHLNQYSGLIKEECNVKEVVFKTLSIEGQERYVNRNLKIHFAGVGKRLPHKAKQIIQAVKNKEWQLADDHLLICEEILLPSEFEIVLEPKASNVAVLADGKTFIILNTTLTPELALEGLARDVVRTIQQARKDAGLHISDRITLGIKCNDHLTKAIEVHKDYICNQTLCNELEFTLLSEYIYKTTVKIDNDDLELIIRKEPK